MNELVEAMKHPNPGNPQKDFCWCKRCRRLKKCWCFIGNVFPVWSLRIPDNCDMKAEYLMAFWNK